MASLALTWDQLVAGPRRTRTARMEASINAKLDMQSSRDVGAGKEMLARLEVNERAQAQLARTEGLLAEKLEQEMKALMELQQRLSSLGVNQGSSAGSEPSSSSSSSPTSSYIDTSIIIAAESFQQQQKQQSIDMSSLKAEIASASITQDGSSQGSMTLNLKIKLTPTASPVA
jgi:hypothetical protein